MKPRELVQLLKKTIEAKTNVLITGAPGIGKTALVQQLAIEMNNELIMMHPVVSDPTDFKGLPWVSADKKSATFLPFGDLASLINANKPTICFIDDIGQSSISVQAASMQLLQGGQINGHKVSDHVAFIGATNRREDKAGVGAVLEPLKSRFIIWNMDANVDDWVAWAIKNDIPTELISFIRWKPDQLHDFKASKDLVNSPCPRTIEKVGDLIKIGVPKDLELEAFTGCVGKGCAGEIVAFLRIFRKLPDPDAVLMNPKKAIVPDDPATLYALCGALAAKASQNTMERIVMYADRLNDAAEFPQNADGKQYARSEFSVLMVRDCIAHDETVTQTRAFIDWSVNHKDVLL